MLDGLRIDHIDGLLDPKAYLERLRAASAATVLSGRREDSGRARALRADWPVEGTTGYEFTNLVLGVLVDPGGRGALDAVYRELHRRTPRRSRRSSRDGKLRIMENEMASELNVLARDAARVARQNPRTADFTRNVLQRAIRQIVASFPVYRTYVDLDGAPADADRRDIDWAMAHARRVEPTSIRASSISCRLLMAAIWSRSRAAASAAPRCCASR